jgi:hypothetical protein
MGTLDITCDDDETDISDIPDVFGDMDQVKQGGETALAFCCIALPFVLLALVGSAVRGFKLSGNKLLTTASMASSWLCTLFLLFPWTIYLGIVESQTTDDSLFTVTYGWAFAFIAWFFSMLCGVFMTLAMVSKGDSSFGSVGTAHASR